MPSHAVAATGAVAPRAEARTVRAFFFVFKPLIWFLQQSSDAQVLFANMHSLMQVIFRD